MKPLSLVVRELLRELNLEPNIHVTSSLGLKRIGAFLCQNGHALALQLDDCPRCDDLINWNLEETTVKGDELCRLSPQRLL